MTPGRVQLQAVLALTFSTAAWGSTFFLSKPVITRHDPMSVIAARFALGALAMALVRPQALRNLSRTTWVRAAALGAIYGLGQLPHYYGLRLVPAAAAGFLVGCFVVFTPVLNLLFFGVRPSPTTLAGVLLATTGLAVFASGDLGLGAGLVLCLVAALLYALQITLLGGWSPGIGAYALTTIQMGTIALVVGTAAAVKGWDPPTSRVDWLVVGYLALVAGVFAIGVQTWAQQRLPTASAAVVMAGEPLWAALLAVTFTAETLTTRLVLGGALLLVANVVISVRVSDRDLKS